MAITVKDALTDRLVRELSGRTGESLTQAIRVAVRERLERLRAARRPGLADDIARVAKRSVGRPVRDGRTAEQVLGYSDTGLPD